MNNNINYQSQLTSYTSIHNKKNTLLDCSRSNSGMFFKLKSSPEAETYYSGGAFSKEIEDWQVAKGIESLSEFAQNGKALQESGFWALPAVKFLMRRKIKVDKFGTPALNKYEAILYCAEMGIPYRTEKIDEKASWCKQLQVIAKHRNNVPVKDLHPINIFNLDPSTRNSKKKVLSFIIDRLNELKSLDLSLYKGIHLIPQLIDIDDGRSSPATNDFLNKEAKDLHSWIKFLEENQIFDEAKDLKEKLNNPNFNEIEYMEELRKDFLDRLNPQACCKKLITELESGNMIKFDSCPYNIVLSNLAYDKHMCCCAFIIDTQDSKKPRVQGILGFNSWSSSDKTCPLKQIEKILNKHQSNKINLMRIYYGAQGKHKEDWDSDGNCVLYTLNTINALLTLLADKSSFREKIVEWLRSDWQPTIDEIKEVINQAKHALLLESIEDLIKILGRVLSAILIIMSLFESTLTITALTSILLGIAIIVVARANINTYYTSIAQLRSPKEAKKEMEKTFNRQCRSSIKQDLQRALPQYFCEKDGKPSLKSFAERKVIHIQDRWILGCLEIEEKIKLAAQQG